MKLAITTLLCLGLGGTVMGLVLILLRRLFGSRLPSAFYYYAWLLVLLRFVVPLPGLMPAAGEGSAAETSAAPAPAEHYARPYLSDIPADNSGADDSLDGGRYYITYSEETDIGAESGAVSELSDGKSAAGFFDSLRQTVKKAVTSWRFWGIVWLIGAVAAAAWYVAGYNRFARVVRRTERAPTDEDLRLYFSVAVKRRPGLMRSRAVPTPMLMGLFRPVIVLPNREYEPETLRNILAHELTHYRRGDIAYKWFAALVFSVHWMNPFAALFRWEIDRACELSCDEQLLKHMSAEEKRSYGATLLELATKRRFPSRVIATSFATQKRDLKERLEQIMKYKNKGKAALATALAAALILAGCGAALGPGAASDESIEPSTASAEVTPTPVPTPVPTGTGTDKKEVTVSTVDEFLAAIDSDTIITLSAGTYDLSTAADYGNTARGNYTWTSVYDGYRLELSGISGLVLAADGDVSISAVPRYADVLYFYDCADIVLEGLTLGHTVEPGECAGGVVYFDSTTNVNLGGCKLYGCGVVGITARNSRYIYAVDCDIYDCSSSAVNALSVSDFRLSDSRVYNCGSGSATSPLFIAAGATGFAVVNTEAYDNQSGMFLSAMSSPEVYVLGCDLSRGNDFRGGVFDISGSQVTVDGCGFAADEPKMYTDTSDAKAQLPDGTELDSAAAGAMKLEKKEYSGPSAPMEVEVDVVKYPDGTSEAHVSTVDEFLSAIAPDTTIYLDAANFDLSTATVYGGAGAEYYYWETNYDGPGLVISGVSNLTLISENGAEISAVPRFVDVLSFVQCDDLTLSGLTLGHTEEPGECSGGVLSLERCKNTAVNACKLYGCGIVGITAYNCDSLAVADTEIYDCSVSALQMIFTTGATLTNCDIHDCAAPEEYTDTDGKTVSVPNSFILAYDGTDITLSGCDIHDCGIQLIGIGPDSSVTVDGEKLDGSYSANYVLEDGKFTVYEP